MKEYLIRDYLQTIFPNSEISITYKSHHYVIVLIGHESHLPQLSKVLHSLHIITLKPITLLINPHKIISAQLVTTQIHHLFTRIEALKLNLRFEIFRYIKSLLIKHAIKGIIVKIHGRLPSKSGLTRSTKLIYKLGLNQLGSYRSPKSYYSLERITKFGKLNIQVIITYKDFIH